MAWRRPGYKPLSEPMIVRLPTHICVARPQWVKIASTCKTELHSHHGHNSIKRWRLNKYKKSHNGVKTTLHPPYPYNGISYMGNSTPSYWITVQLPFVLCHWGHLVTADNNLKRNFANKNISIFRAHLFLFYTVLTHLPLLPHICISELGQYWFR